MAIQDLSSLDRTVFQPLGRLLQEAFADGFTSTGSITVTKSFDQATDYNRILYMTGNLAGGGGCNYGMFKFRTYIESALSHSAHTLCANLHIKDAGELADAGEWASSPIYATVETEVTTTAPTLSGGSLAAIYIGYYVDESVAGPDKAYAIQFNNHPSYNWDGLIRMGAGDIGDSAHSATGSHVVGFDSDAAIRKIPVLIDGVTHYLLVGTPAETAD